MTSRVQYNVDSKHREECQIGFLNTGDGHEVFSYEETDNISSCWDCKFKWNIPEVAPCCDCNGAGHENWRDYFQEG